MSIVLSATPSVQRGLDRLDAWLAAEGYGPEPTGRILAYVAAEGTLSGCPDLDPGDEEWAEWSYVEGLAPVAGVSSAWDEYHSEPSRGPVYQSVDGDYALDRLSHRLGQLEREPIAVAIPPVCGGAPEPPSPEQIRAWYETRPSFGDWVAEQGGVEWEE